MPTGTNVNATAAATMAGINVGTLLIARDQPAALTVPAGVRMSASKRLEIWQGSLLAFGTGAAVGVGTTPAFTADQVNVTAGGTLVGDGAIAATVNNLSGTISPCHSIGALNINGSFTQAAAAAIGIDLGAVAPATGYDQLNVTGTAALGGTLRVDTANGFTPLPGQSFDVLTFGSRSGDVAIDNQTGYAGLVLNKSYSAGKLTQLASAAIDGDANLDGLVDTLDFNALPQTSAPPIATGCKATSRATRSSTRSTSTCWPAISEALPSRGLRPCRNPPWQRCCSVVSPRSAGNEPGAMWIAGRSEQHGHSTPAWGCHRLTSTFISERDGTRTRNHRIDSPLVPS